MSLNEENASNKKRLMTQSASVNTSDKCHLSTLISNFSEVVTVLSFHLRFMPCILQCTTNQSEHLTISVIDRLV